MDGVRAYWEGTKMVSRHGKKVNLPQTYTSALPHKTQLDGELWMGRGTFEVLLGILKSKNEEESKWKQIGYYVFDLPSSVAPYEQRLVELNQLKLPPQVHIVESIRCKGMEHSNFYLEQIIEEGGEGLMAREPGSLYTIGLSARSLLKVKVSSPAARITMSAI